MTNIADPDQLPTDLDLHCLQRQGISRFSRTRVNGLREIFPLKVSPCGTQGDYIYENPYVPLGLLGSYVIYMKIKFRAKLLWGVSGVAFFS